MKRSVELLINIGAVLIGAALASGIYLQLSGERGWIKFAAWLIFFVSIQTPFFFTKTANKSCSILAWLKKRN